MTSFPDTIKCFIHEHEKVFSFLNYLYSKKLVESKCNDLSRINRCQFLIDPTTREL
jgi:hypothetical protein